MNPVLSLQAFVLSGGEATQPQAVIEFQLAPQWHIYWDNYGDSGMSTSIDNGVLVYPIPKKIPLPGSLISYGYEGRVVFFIDTPKDTVLVRWLACKDDTCIPGKRELSFLPAESERFQKERVALPTDCSFTWEHLSDNLSRVVAEKTSWMVPYSELVDSVHSQYHKNGAHYVQWNTKKPKGRYLWISDVHSCIIHI